MHISLPPQATEQNWRPTTPGEPQAFDPNDKPSLEPQQIAQLARQHYDDAQPMQRLWSLCRDVITGFRQYTNQDIAVRAGMELAYFNRARDISFNITQPQYRNVSARFETDMPSWGAIPSSYSIQALVKAMACEQALRYHHREAEVKYVLQDALDWAILFGTSAVLTEMEGDDVVETAFGPDRLRAEPGIPDPDKSRFLAVSRITTKAALKARFPGHDAVIDQAAPPTVQTTWWGDTQRLPVDRVEVLEVYCRSGHWYLLVGSGGTVLAQGITPKRCMPIQVIRYTRVPTDFWGMGLVEQALPAQYAYSASWNQILANARYMSQPKVLIHKNSGVAPDAFTSRAGEKVFYTGKEPSAWPGQPLPQYAQQLPASSLAAMSDATGVHAQSLGKRTPGITTGVAMQQLTSQDEVQFGHTKVGVNRAVERMGRCALLYMQAYYPPDKFMQEFDRFGSAIGTMVRATDLDDNPQVFIEAGTLFKEDVEARQQRVIELARMGNGIIPPDKILWMLQNKVDPLAPQKPIADYVEAMKALDAVIAYGYEHPDPRGGIDPMTGLPLMRPTVKFYRTDNFEAYADVVRQFIRSDRFNELDEARQDDIDRFYTEILNAGAASMGGGMQPGVPGSGQAPMAKPAQLPGLPAGATPGVTPGNPGQGAMGTSDDRAVQLQQGKAEVADEHTRV